MNAPHAEKIYNPQQLAQKFLLSRETLAHPCTSADAAALAELVQHIYDEGARHQATYIWADCGQYDYENWKVPTTFYVTWTLPAIAETLPSTEKDGNS